MRESNKGVWQLITIAAAGWKSWAWQVLLADRFPLQSPNTNVRLNKNPSGCMSAAALPWESAGRALLYFRNLLPLLFTSCQDSLFQPVQIILILSILSCLNEFYVCFVMKLFPWVSVKGLFEMILHPQVFLKPIHFDCNYFVWGEK